MFGQIQTGKLGFGLMPFTIPCKLVNRVGTALQDGEVLMLDLENVAYGTSADEAGVFGNGITPLVSGTGGAALVGMNWPMALVTKGWGSASGAIVDCIAAGKGTAAVLNTGAVAAIKGVGIDINTGARNPNVRNASMTAPARTAGFLLTAHTAAVGVERVLTTFNGILTR